MPPIQPPVHQSIDGQPAPVDRIADREHVLLGKEHVHVAVGMRGNRASARTDTASTHRPRARFRCRTSCSVARLSAAAATVCSFHGHVTSVVSQSRVFSCATIVAPALPSGSFEPVCSGCQCVLNSVWTLPPPGSAATRCSSAADSAAEPPSTSATPVAGSHGEHVRFARGEHAEAVAEVDGLATGGLRKRARRPHAPKPERQAGRAAHGGLQQGSARQ